MSSKHFIPKAGQFFYVTATTQAIGKVINNVTKELLPAYGWKPETSIKLYFCEYTDDFLTKGWLLKNLSTGQEISKVAIHFRTEQTKFHHPSPNILKDAKSDINDLMTIIDKDNNFSFNIELLDNELIDKTLKIYTKKTR